MNKDLERLNNHGSSYKENHQRIEQFEIEERNSISSVKLHCIRYYTNRYIIHVEGASVYNATLNICKSGFGTTILFMPYVFMKCGFILAIILMSFTGLLCYYAWIQLIRVIQRIEEKENNSRRVTLNIAAEVVLGHRMMLISEIFTVFFNFGTILSYMVFIQKSMIDILENKLALCKRINFLYYYLVLLIISNLSTLLQIFQIKDITYNFYFSFIDFCVEKFKNLICLQIYEKVVIMGMIFLPISLYKNIEKLGIFSQLGLASFFAAVFVIIGKSLYLIFTGENTSNQDEYSLNLFSFNEIPLFFGVYVFAYDINGVVTDVYASMKEKDKFDLILKRYIVVMCLTGLITGSIGYSAFKDKTSDLIFSNLIDMGVVQKILKIFYSISLLGSILLYGFPIMQRVDVFMERKYLNNIFIGRTLVRILFFLLIYILATQLPRLTDVFNLLGCFFSIGLGFVFPILLAEKISEGEKDTKRKIMNYLVVFIGLIGGASGVVSTIFEIF